MPKVSKEKMTLLKRMVAGSLVVCAVAAVCGLAACQPSANPSTPQNNGNAASSQAEEDSTADTKDDASVPTSVGGIHVADFQDANTGYFADDSDNARRINQGNRGCGACHENLWPHVSTGDYYPIITAAGLKEGNWYGDCMTCHGAGLPTGGPTAGDDFHTIHYTSPMFTEGGGTCLSCHVTAKNADGEVTFQLFDVVKYDDDLGGYVNAASFMNNPIMNSIDWATKRGKASGSYSGTTLASDQKVTATFDQDVIPEDQQWIAINYKRIDGNDEYAAIDPATWTLEVTTPSGTQQLTLDDIKAMPATEKNVAHTCMAVGQNTSLVQNMPVKGVNLADFIEAIGGVGDSTAVTTTSIDGWLTAVGPCMSLQWLLEHDAMLCYENFGHDLTVDQGAPVRWLIPNCGGSLSTKNLTSLKFANTESFATPSFDTKPFTSWIDVDGVEGTAGQPMELEGVAWAVTYGDPVDIVAVEVSFDYGQTWTRVDVPFEADPEAWVHFTLNWTPEKAGTYVAKLRLIDGNGYEQPAPASLIVKINE